MNGRIQDTWQFGMSLCTCRDPTGFWPLCLHSALQFTYSFSGDRWKLTCSAGGCWDSEMFT